MTPRTVASLVALLATACTLGACARPGITLVRVDASSAGAPAGEDASLAQPQPAQAQVILSAQNRTDRPLPLRRVRVRVMHEGVTVASVERDPLLTLPPNSERTITIPVTIPAEAWAQVSQDPSRLQAQGEVFFLRPSAFSRTLADAHLVVPREGF